MTQFFPSGERMFGSATFLASSARRRVALAGGLVAVLWLGVWWAMTP